ncbi:MAG: lipid A deacylase LpxR family protein [Gammaproteobacteria bacterium]|nr:lipid A deacylase LpxR family protein [Gammaproteobacteria bacterium]MCP5135197.1 lipid A deacylase LpxR family protein [Gammaproteobacteria bacterium]
MNEKAWLSIVLLGSGLLTGPIAHADTSEGSSDINLQVENDLFVGDGYDQHYTHGMRLSTLYDRESLPEFFTEFAEDLWLSGRARGEIGLGMSIFTPQDITTTLLQTQDRPYAGWTYLSFGLFSVVDEASNRSPRLDTLAVDVGIVGPSSYAGEIQKWWHDEVISAPHPSGWQHQLNDEIAGVMYLSSVWRKPLTQNGNIDFLPSVGLALGTVESFASAGGTLRIGTHLEDDFGPPRIRPNRPGAGFITKPRDMLSGYLFAGVEGRLVGHNLFLDGNTFTDSHRVDKKYLVADAQAGWMISYGRLRFSYAQMWRSKEYTTQRTADSFGALSLTWNLPF